MTTPLFGHARGAVIGIGSAIGFDQTVTVFANALPGISDTAVVQLAEKGGGWLVLLIVLFFYRRDYQRLTNSENEIRKELLAAINRQSESESELKVAITANTEVVRSALAQLHGEQYDEGRRR